MKLGQLSDRSETLSKPDIFAEWEKSLPEHTKNIQEAKKYFSDMETKSGNETIDIKDINTGYIYILDDCITFAKNKEKHLEAMKPGLNDYAYEKMIGRDGYNGTVLIAENLVDAFFDPKLNAALRDNEKPGKKSFLNSDARAQAYRICHYVLTYLAGYTTDDRLSANTKKKLFKILGVEQEHEEFINSSIPETNIIEWLEKNSDGNDIDVLVTALKKLEDADHINQFIIEYVPYARKYYPVEIGEEQYLSIVAKTITGTIFLSTMDGDIKNIWFSVLADLLHDIGDKNIPGKETLQLDE